MGLLTLPSVPVRRREAVAEAGSWTALFVLLMILRAPEMLARPRFWAEEATYYFVWFASASVPEALLHVHLGSYQLLENLFVLLATTVPLELAPTVTTGLAFAAQMVVAYQLGMFIREHRLPTAAGILLMCAWTLQWGMHEVALSATNVQWITGASVLITLAMPRAWIDRNAWRVAAGLAVCGLSGIPATLAAPAFVLRALLTRHPTLLRVSLVLLACGMLQAAIALTHGTPGRTFPTSASILLLPTLMQVGVMPFTGPEPLFVVGTYLQGGLPEVGMLAASAAIIGAGSIALATYLAWVALRERRVPALVAAVLSVSLVQTFAALAPDALLIAGGARYFVAGVTGLLILLGLGSTGRRIETRAISTGLLAVSTAASLAQLHLGSWTTHYTSGPSWKDELSRCTGETCIVRVWPDDGTHYLVLRRDGMVSSTFPERLAPVPAH